MQRTLLSIAAMTCVAAALTAQCTTPTSFTTFTNSTTFSGAPSFDPGPCFYFDMTVTAGVTINTIGVNFYNNGGTFGTPPVTRPLFSTMAPGMRLELWLVNTTGGANGGSVNANLPRTYLINGGGSSTFPAAPWSQAPGSFTSGPITMAALDTPSTATVTPLHLNPGTYGCCLVMIPANTTTTTTATAADRLFPLFTNAGVGATISDQIFSVTTQGYQATAFAGSPAAQYMPNMVFGYAVDAGTALSNKYGNGCYDRKKSFYESFNGPANAAGAAPNVTATSLTMLPLGTPVNQYFVQPSAATYPAIVPGSTNYYDTNGAGATPTHVNTINGAVAGGGWDDTNSVLYPLPFPLQHPGGTATSISICSNGVVYLNSTAGRRFFFDLFADFVTLTPAFAVSFGDLWPADNATFQGGVGEIYCDYNGTDVAVSWVNCDEYPNSGYGTTGNTFQVVFHPSGVVDYLWGSARNSDSAPILIGYSAGDGKDTGAGQTSPRGACPNPLGGLTGFVAAGSFLSGNGDLPPVLTCVDRPKTGTILNLRTNNLDASITAVATFISLTSLAGGIDLGPAGVNLGMPGCNGYIITPEILLLVGAPTLGSVDLTTAPFPIPGFAAGFNVFAQSVAVSNASPAFNIPNWLVSNGVCMQINNN